MSGNAFAQSEETKTASGDSFKYVPSNRLSLIEILDKLERNLGVSFAYQKKFLSGKFASYRLILGSELEPYLSEILSANQLKFKKIEDIQESIYVISPLEDNLLVSEVKNDTLGLVQNVQPKILVYGAVTGADERKPIPGVNVLLKGTKSGSITDQNGNFVIEVPHGKNNILVFSYIGFATQELPASENHQMNVVLLENFQSLPEVIVTALGISRDQKALGYSVSKLNGDLLRASANTNVVSALYGETPGVRIRTAPGGATSAVTMQIRGLNSLNYSTQPLYVVDGVVIRDGNERGAMGVNNDDYFTDTRIRGNGILDINSFDIETLTILKGASASALYGSDASSGVVLITTKAGHKRKGEGVEINYQFTQEEVAFTPKYQNTYGPGYDLERNLALGANAEGFVPVDGDGDGFADGQRPLFESHAQFGPRMNGQNVYWWDGAMRAYTPQPDNYKDFFRKGYSSAFNINLANQIARWSYYISYTRRDYAGIQVGGKLERNSLNVRTALDLNDRISIDLAVNYTNSFVHNRPLKINRLMSSWSGFFSRAEKMSLFFDNYQTSEGYKWVPYDQAIRNPEEALHFTTPRGYEVMDLFWRQLRDSEDETQDRIISSFTLNYDIQKNLRLRIRGGEDFTLLKTQTREHNLYSTEFNTVNSTGVYAIGNGNYSLFYGDGLLSYSSQVIPRIRVAGDLGFQLRGENYHTETIATEGGLALENWFKLSNSYNPNLNTSEASTSILKYAMLGVVKFQYKNFLFLEGTGRQEYSSTLPPGNNSYFYPSVNSAFIFSEILERPSIIDFGKLRLSYGIVGNAPPAYEANILYSFQNLQTNSGSVVAATSNGELYGNDNIKPERKRELEAGLETHLFNRNLGIDLAFYSSRTVDQIMKLDVPSSTGADRVLINGGELSSHGWEAGVFVFPLKKTVSWKSNINIAYNTTKLRTLPNSVDRLVLRSLEGNSIQVVAERGQPLGNIYVYPRARDNAGNLIISDEGLYVINKEKYEKVGNVLPKVTGGVINSFNYKNVSVAINFDYSLGGQIISPSLKYGVGAGLYTSTLKFRDEEQGGLPYYIDGNGKKVLLPNHDAVAPDNANVFHDGIILNGVRADGSANATIIDAATYYLNTFDWGSNAWNEEGAVYDNSYIKLRELLLTYTFPAALAEKMHLKNIRVSLVGRNLFYVWRTLKNLDPESTIGSNWLNQGIDEGAGAATRSYGFSFELNF